MRLRALKQEKRQAERQWRKDKLTVHKQIMTSVKHKITQLVDSAKTMYYSAKVAAASSCKELFSVANSLVGKVMTSPLPANIQPQQMAQDFSDFFTSKVQLIRDTIDSQVTTGSGDPVGQYQGNTLSNFDLVDQAVVRETMLKMKPTSCDLDPIPTGFLFDCSDVVLPALTSVLNDCIQTGHVPSSLKKAIVKPLIKKASLDPNVHKNFRPVSNLCFVSKLLEKLVLNQLQKHLDVNNLWPVFQSAYRCHHSTETALIRVLNDLLSSNDSNLVSVLTLLDLSAAFDTIDHEILLSRLESFYGITGTALSFFRSYLSDRSQVVSTRSSTSKPESLRYGVPQGSVLGPILFLLYTQPLSRIIVSHGVSHQMFADDTELYKSSPRDSVPSLINTMQACTTDVKNWTVQNKLQLNEDKTEVLLVSTSHSHALPATMKVGPHDIHFADSARNLGVIFDKSLSMSEQVNKICQVCYIEIRKIASIRHYLTTEATKTLVTSLVLSRLDYCNSALVGIPQHLLDKLQKVMNSAARLIFKISKREHITPFLKQLHWLPVNARIEYKIATLCFHCLDNTAPLYISELLQLYTPSRSLRSAGDTRIFRIPKVRLASQGHRAFAFSGPVIWNGLPREVRYCATIGAFKSNLKTFLFKKYYD
jgi:hypothetical protein